MISLYKYLFISMYFIQIQPKNPSFVNVSIHHSVSKHLSLFILLYCNIQFHYVASVNMYKGKYFFKIFLRFIVVPGR